MSYADYTMGSPVEDDAAPGGSIDTRWERHRFGVKLVNPANKRKMKVIVVGTGLAGGSAAATLFTLIVVLGFLTVPLGVLTGFLREAPGVAAQAQVGR